MIFVSENGLERHDIASSNRLPAFLYSKSFDSVSPLLECPGEIFYLARRWSRQDLLEKSPGKNIKNEFLATPGSHFLIRFKQISNFHFKWGWPFISQAVCTKPFKCFPSTESIETSSSNFGSFKTSRICGPTKMPAFRFASLVLKNLLQKNANPLGILFSSCLTKFFIKPNFIWRKLIHLLGQLKGPLWYLRFLECMLLWLFSLVWHIVLQYSTTIHRQRKQQCFVYPPSIPIKMPMIFRSPHRYHLYSLYWMASRRISILL